MNNKIRDYIINTVHGVAGSPLLIAESPGRQRRQMSQSLGSSFELWVKLGVARNRVNS